MSAEPMVVIAIGLLAASGLVAISSSRAGATSAAIAVAGAVLGCAIGLVGAAVALASGGSSEAGFTWHVPGGAAIVGVDVLTAFFLTPLFAVGGLAAVFGQRYMSGHARGVSLGLAAGAFNLLLVAMAIVVVARHALLFLCAWEAMTLIAYLLITFDHADAEVRRAGWVYLIASHVAMVALLAMFLTLGEDAGGRLDFTALGEAHRTTAGAIALPLVLAVLGFGVKAGAAGLHVWLPEAHAAAPSHVSALMSGVLIKLGLYGLLRVALLVPPPAWFGLTVAGLGLAGAVTGISLALYQRDLKRALAYSSIENVGIILLGLGVGMWARARGNVSLAVLATGGGLLHLWNHAAMKGLLFLGAGSLLHGSGTKDVEKLGGLLRRMRWTGGLWIFGAIAISGLPPLNGFASEWLIYRALLDVGVTAQPAAALAAIGAIAILALVGGLAGLCFLRLVGVVLLGEPRSTEAAQAHESPRAMTAPLGILAALCVVAAVLPDRIMELLGPLIATLAGAESSGIVEATRSLAPVIACNAALAAGLAVVAIFISRRVRAAAETDTWGCGFAAPTARMQYTGRSFAEMAVDRLLPRWLRHRQRVDAPDGLFPRAATYSADTADPLTRSAYEPLLVRWGNRFARLRWLQQGSLHLYLLYIVAVAILGLTWVSARSGWWWR